MTRSRYTSHSFYRPVRCTGCVRTGPCVSWLSLGPAAAAKALVNFPLYHAEVCEDFDERLPEKARHALGTKKDRQFLDLNRQVLQAAFPDEIYPRRTERTGLWSASRRLRKRIRAAAERLTLPLRLKPSFVIIGAQRSGTTSLFNYLIQHPQILPPTHKEIHYFDWLYQKGLAYYRRQFPIRPFKLQRTITGEASPEYMLYRQALERIAQTLPDIKLIILLRNPVDRAYSHFRSMSYHREPLTFPEAVAQEKQRLDAALARHDLYTYSLYSYLTRGRYAEQIENVFELFPRQQVMIIKSEDLYANTDKVVHEVWRFLDLPAWDTLDTQNFTDKARQQTTPLLELKQERLGFPDDLRTDLVAYFRPYNHKLYDLLGRDMGWDHTPGDQNNR